MLPKKYKYKKPKLTKRKVTVNLFYRRTDFLSAASEWGLLAASSTRCFTHDTPILLADGSSKDISEIKIGDRVFSYDILTGQLKENKVSKLYSGDSAEQLLINGKIRVTRPHAFWVNNAYWLPADALKLGDRLLNKNGRQIEIVSIDIIRQKTQVYNLRLANHLHNFFAHGVLVHNMRVKGGDPS